MSTPNKGIGKVEVTLKWDPSPPGAPAHDLDIVAATYPANEPYGNPRIRALRQPLAGRHHQSQPGQQDGPRARLGRGDDPGARPAVGRVRPRGRRGRHPAAGRPKDLRRHSEPGVRIREGYTSGRGRLLLGRRATAATVAEFVRDGSGGWEFRETSAASRPTRVVRRTMGQHARTVTPRPATEAWHRLASVSRSMAPQHARSRAPGRAIRGSTPQPVREPEAAESVIDSTALTS